MKVELGISTFGETTKLEDGSVFSHDERIRQIVKEIELADQVGLDVYAIGEHHRKDFAVSNPEIILAAGAVNTKKIRLSSAVNVLSSADPIRLYQNYASIDALSSGRAEIMVGRGSFIESFALFGYDLKNYEALFDEKLAMLQEINKQELLTWNGKFTPTVKAKGVYPRAMQQKLPIWVGTGGNYESTVKIAKQGLPISYAIIGGRYRDFKGLIQSYRMITEECGYSKEETKVSSHSWGYLADTKEEAIKDYFFPTKLMVDQISTERSHWSEMTYQQYLDMIGPEGSMFVGDFQSVADKIIRMVETLGLDRFLLHLPIGSLPHEKVLNAIRIFGEKVAPIVRESFKDR